MSTGDYALRDTLKPPSLEEGNLTRETTRNEYATPPKKPYSFLVPSTVNSTLGSPVSISQPNKLKDTDNYVRQHWQLEPSRRP